MAANFLLDKGDKALRVVGVFEIWKNIVVSLVIAILCSVGVVALLRYHSDWKHGEFKVTNVHCQAPTQHKSCNDGSCKSYAVTSCSVTVDGFDVPFSTSYTAPDTPPSVGASAKVFYDPKDKSRAFLAHDDFLDAYKTWFFIGLVVLIVSALASAGFQYYVRGSHLAQRVEGGVAVFNMATDA